MTNVVQKYMMKVIQNRLFMELLKKEPSIQEISVTQVVKFWKWIKTVKHMLHKVLMGIFLDTVKVKIHVL